MMFCDSSVVFYGAGCIGYRWAFKVITAIGEGRLKARGDAGLCLEVLEQYANVGDFEGATAQFRALRRIFGELASLEISDFERSARLFEVNPTASPRLLLRTAVMERMGSKKILAAFSTRCDRIRGLERVNAMAEL